MIKLCILLLLCSCATGKADIKGDVKIAEEIKIADEIKLAEDVKVKAKVVAGIDKSENTNMNAARDMIMKTIAN